MPTRREFLKSLPGQLFQGLFAKFHEHQIRGHNPDLEKPTLPLKTIHSSQCENSRKRVLNRVMSPYLRQIARLDVSRCLAYSGSDCQLCYVACPRRDQALIIRQSKPMIVPGLCDGCSMCQTACATVNDLSAVTMISI